MKSKQPRILQVLAGAHHGGAELFFERNVIALQEEGLAQRAVIRRDAQRAARLEGAGVEVLQLPFGKHFDFTTKPAIAKTIGEFKPDIVLSYMSRAAAAVPARVPGHAFIHVGRLGGYYDLKHYRTCDHLIGISKDLVRDFIARGWPADRAHHITNYVESAPAAPLARADYETPDDRPLLLGLGRLHRNKGFDILLKALARVPGAWLWIAGSGPEEKALARLADELGVSDRVRFLGWRDDIPALLATADLFVCSSRHEPLGSIVIEPWAHDTALVALAAQGPSELISDGEDGLLVPLEDPEALAGAIRRVLGDPALRDSLIEKGRRTYEQNHTRRIVIDRYLRFFSDVITQAKQA